MKVEEAYLQPHPRTGSYTIAAHFLWSCARTSGATEGGRN